MTKSLLDVFLKNNVFCEEDCKMINTIYKFSILVPLILIIAISANTQEREFYVLRDGVLNSMVLFGIGVDDSKGLSNWLAEAVDGLELKYPGGLQWGAVFITAGGDPVPPPRDELALDFSQYSELIIEMKGDSGGECVMVGIKDCNDPDNGREPKQSVILNTTWNDYTFNIDSIFAQRHPSLSSLDMKRLYVVAEFVFPCESNIPQTIYVKNIKYRR